MTLTGQPEVRNFLVSLEKAALFLLNYLYGKTSSTVYGTGMDGIAIGDYLLLK